MDFQRHTGKSDISIYAKGNMMHLREYERTRCAYFIRANGKAVDAAFETIRFWNQVARVLSNFFLGRIKKAFQSNSLKGIVGYKIFSRNRYFGKIVLPRIQFFKGAPEKVTPAALSGAEAQANARVKSVVLRVITSETRDSSMQLFSPSERIIHATE